MIIAPYWTSEVYGFGKWIRKYAGYPFFLPLCVDTDHGPPVLGYPSKLEIASDAPCMLTHCPKYKMEWEKVTNKNIVIFPSPFVICKRKLKFKKKADAKGTIAFPAHSTVNVEEVSDIEKYISDLLKLPSRFKPISVCLYYDDIVKGRGEIYKKHGIPVLTAGYYFDSRFTEMFYEILSNFKYATSNLVGSYLYYSIEMDIPFSIYGEHAKYENRSDPNLTIGKYEPLSISPFYKKVYKSFSGLNTTITKDQKRFVEKNLGLVDAVSPQQMRKILYKSFILWLFSPRPIKFFFNGLRRLLFKKG